MADVLFSAIFHSGIQTARTLHLFAKAVASRTGLFSDEQQIWIETELNNAPTNFIDRQGELHSHWRFFLHCRRWVYYSDGTGTEHSHSQCLMSWKDLSIG